MFKKIRTRFVIIVASVVTSVLFISLGTINILNFTRIDHVSDDIIYNININEDSKLEPPSHPIGNEPFFIAKYDSETSSMIVDEKSFKRISTITIDDAKTMAIEVRNSKQTKGYKGNYRFNVFNDSKYIFLDTSMQKDSAYRFLKSSMGGAIGGTILIVVLVYLCSKYFLKPVKESYEKQNRFITNASHELKTPLAVISSNNRLLEMKGVNNDCTENIGDEVKKLNRLVKDLVDYSKINEITTIYKKKFNLTNKVNDLIKVYKIVFKDYGIKLTLKIGKDIYIKNDIKIVDKMLNIILDNARKYAISNVNVTLTKSNHYIYFTEINDTKEIKQNDVKHLTERFYRTPNSRKNDDGFGIGLAILKDLCDKTKTKLSISSDNKKYKIELRFHK